MFISRYLIIFPLIILIFSLFFKTTPLLAQSATASSVIATESAESEQDSWLQSILNWFKSLFLGVFVKEYEIDVNSQDSQQRQQFTNYGQKDDGNPYGIGNRAVNDMSQFCLKGEVIKTVILDKEADKPLAKVCSGSCLNLDDPTPTGSNCTNITISNLAYYFFQNNESFYCNDQNQKIAIESEVIEKINEKNINTQLVSDSNCYQKIYQQFYLVPPEADKAAQNINTNRILSQPIPAQSQSSIDTDDENQIGADNKSKKILLDQLITPDSEDRKGLTNLVPESWQ